MNVFKEFNKLVIEHTGFGVTGWLGLFGVGIVPFITMVGKTLLGNKDYIQSSIEKSKEKK
jgi:hypothetical protein